MKILISLFLVALPATAQACGAQGGGQGGCGSAPFLLSSVIAALGYWVLQHSGKETAAYIKRTGIAVGLALLVIGLLGLMCALGSHVKKSCGRSCGPDHGMMMSQEQAADVEMKVTVDAKKKAK